MSFFVYSHSTVEKKMFTTKEHRSVIRKLKRGEIEQTMRSFQKYRLDKSLEESEEIMYIIRSLCDESAVGRIVEYVYRQILNESDGPRIEPIQYLAKPNVVKEKSSAHRFRKAQSLGFQFLRFMIDCKIEDNPEAYEQEKEADKLAGIMNKEKSEFSFEPAKEAASQEPMEFQEFSDDDEDFIIIL